MKLDTHNDIATTTPLNSAADFRAELNKLKQEDGNPEVSNESEETTTAEPEGANTEHSIQGDVPDSDNSESISDSADDDFDSRAPVPPSRLKKEIAKRKALEDTIAQERMEKIRAQTELDMISKALRELNNPSQTNQQPKSDGFDPLDEDAHKYNKQHFAPKDKVEAVEAQLLQMQFTHALTMQEAAFERDNPDFKDAYQHLYKTEITANQYVTNDPKQAEWMATSKLQGMAKMALEQGKNVAEVFYNMSKSYGYAPKSKSKQSSSNLDAIETNMRKSKVADVPAASVAPGNGASNYTILDNFNKLYSGNPHERNTNAEKFHEVLRKIKEGR